MSLAAGARLGPYEIVAPLGAGGMGEVYRARDTRLKRDIALKVLPDAVATDPERLARFEREAQVLAALNHPHIAAIHGVEDSGGTPALVIELVDGPTLADRLRRGAVPLDEALPIARQIAEALEAAHDAGIVHRDLKPANIKLRPDGTVKVLDFGLAKALDPGASNLVRTESPTITSPAMTHAGVILGTAAYMSPEQARGKLVDHRADIWAFGCVLYEMLTGTRAFPGQEIADVIAKVIEREPDWSALPADTAPEVRRVLRRCLTKHPGKRLHHIVDARLELDESSPSQTVRAADRPRTRAVWIAFAAAALVALLTAVPAVIHLREAPAAAPPEMRVDIVTPPTRDPLSFALSPDGRRLVFVALDEGASRLWVRTLDSAVARPLAGTEDAVYPFWSPDSRSVGFFAGGSLKRVDLTGERPQTLAPVSLPRGGAWTEDGTIVFAPSATGALVAIDANGGDVQAITQLASGQVSHRGPEVAAGTRYLLFYAQGTPEAEGIFLTSLDGATPKRLTGSRTAVRYMASGWLLFTRETTLVAQRLDLARGVLTGDPVTVADPVAIDAVFNMPGLSVSSAGLLAYRAGGTVRRQLTWVDRTGRPVGTVGQPETDLLLHPELSPDGRSVAVQRTVQGNSDVWLFAGNRWTRVTFDPAVDGRPIWSPDGSRLVFRSARAGPGDLYEKPASGAGTEIRLVQSVVDQAPSDFSPDGRVLLFMRPDPKTRGDLWLMPLEDNGVPRPWLQTRADETGGEFSPDGRWIAYQSDESGRHQVYVRPYSGVSGQWQISTDGGVAPRWRRDGKELYYLAPDGALMATTTAVRGGALEPGTPVRLFLTSVTASGVGALRPQYDVAADGRFLLNKILDDAATPAITLLLNWQPR